MWPFRRQKHVVPQTLKNIEEVVATKERKISVWTQGQAALFFTASIVLLICCAVVMMTHFYNARITYSQASWLHVRNLTPIKNVSASTSGILSKVFVSAGQRVQKGVILASIRTDDIQLDYDETKRSFAEKIVELHCLASLKVNKSAFKLPYDAQLLVGEMARSQNMNDKVNQCEQELLKNVNYDQALEEMIASLEDQVRVLDVVVKLRGMIHTELYEISDDEAANLRPFGINQEELRKVYHDKYFPLMQLAIVQQDLRDARASYFSRQLEKEEDLSAAIEQTTQEMRYLSKRLRELDEKMKSNYIYASATGTIVGTETPQVGFEYSEQETIFRLQPLESKFQVGVVLEGDDASRFGKGAFASVRLVEGTKIIGTLSTISAGVFRQPNGKLEALLDLKGQNEKNTNVILGAGYKGEGEQRIQANVTVGQEQVWRSIHQIIKNIIPLQMTL